MKEEKYRTIVFYKDYFQEFFDKQSQKVKEKFIWTFEVIEDLERVPSTYLKQMDGIEGLYEIRVKTRRKYIPCFLFF